MIDATTSAGVDTAQISVGTRGTCATVLDLRDRRVPLGAETSAVADRDAESAETLPQDRNRTFYERFFKRPIDLILSLAVLLVIAPLMAIIALAVRTRLGPEIIFRQVRVGRGGRPFTVYKFRSMAPDRRAAAVHFEGLDRRVTHKHPNDPRLTPFGKFLRSWSLDELPQLWNVVRGDMSLVGPRPELVEIVGNYAPWQHLRHEVKPGLTGLWQVMARGDGMMHENTGFDLEYVRQLRSSADLKILVLTIPAVLGLRRGY